MMVTTQEIDDLIARFRADSKALEGDGFGHTGTLKGEYKKTCRRLEELKQQLLKIPPITPKI
jgi:hypothetical protein